ncbi:restriction modification system DNA specificity subunit [Ectothiorhodospira haloalkaliphila]|uniref:Restriction modification system DNA specificity subunit n=1 Tax=Ectothiorhodospira haloalkaliphila TaxID=421628 RepID=W8KRI1_9GAMM|nr:restriction modification system DNA specificity subunit [Ectothiorhodospira haloalkaliphila]
MCAIVPKSAEGANITQTTARVSPSGNIHSGYLAHYFRSPDFKEEVKKYTKGSAQPGLNLDDVEKMVVRRPQALGEQITIARILDTLDTQILKTEALIAKLEKVKEGLLHDLLTRGIDENGQLRPSPEQAPELYKDSPLGLIPREWGVGSLGDLSEIVSGVTLGGKSGSSSWPLVPYLRVANVQDGYFDLSEVKLIRVSSVDIEKYRLLPGDVLMNEGGDFDKLGRGSLWQGQIGLCIHQNHVFRVRANPSILNPHFLTAFSSSAMGKSYFIRSSKQSTNLASINSTQLKDFQIPLPAKAEQELIVTELRIMASKMESEKSLLDKLITQKTGLMNDLLTGHVRVTPLLGQAQTPTPTPA